MVNIKYFYQFVKKGLLVLLFLFLTRNTFSQNENESTNFLSINQFKVHLSNTDFLTAYGNLSYSPAISWPGGSIAFQSLIWDQHFFWGGYIDTSFVYVPVYKSIVPGKILDNGLPDNPANERYRVYRIRKGWETTPFGPERDQLEKDYNEWPVEDGAPWVDRDNDGIFTRGVDQPKFVGDEVLFFVSNDMDTLVPGYHTLPIGLEVHFLHVRI